MKKKLVDIFIKIGKIFLTIDVLVVLAIVIQSFSIKGKVNYGDRCYVLDDLNYIERFKYEGLELENYELKCNTYYLEYISTLNEKGNILFLNSLDKLLYENDNIGDVQVTIISSDHQIMASIVDNNIYYVKSDIK